MQRFLREILGFFLTTPCPLCGRSAGSSFCAACEKQLQDCRLDRPAQFWQPPLPVFVWGDYRDSLKRAIAALKYQNQPHLARPLGHWMGQIWQKSSIAKQFKPSLKSKRLTIIPIPMHETKLKQRGFNQAALLAQSFCEITGLPCANQGLVRVKATEAQFGLSAEARQVNLSDAFVVGKGLRSPGNQEILLLDDIYTTGATARSAMQVLRSKGYSVHGMIALAIAR